MECVAVGGDQITLVHQFSELISVGGVGHSNSLAYRFRRECKIVSVRIGSEVDIKKECKGSKVASRVLPARIVDAEVWLCRRSSVNFNCPLIRISYRHFKASL